MKKYLVLLLIMLIPFVVKAEECDPNKITISSINIEEKNGSVEEIDEASASGKSINLNLSMSEVGDNIRYKVVVKNESSDDYLLDKNSFNISSDYIDYSFEVEDDDSIVKANSSKTVYLKVEYRNEVPVESFVNDSFSDDKTITVNLSTGEEISVPDTFKNSNMVFQSFIIFILIFCIFTYVLIKKKSIKFMVFIASLSLLIPVSIYAICTCDIKVESKIEIKKSVIVYPEGKTKRTVGVGDIVKIEEEEFYVVNNDGTDLVLLAHYNLKVGNIYTIRNGRIVKLGEYTNEDEGYGLQSSEARGYVGGSEDIRNGTINFSDSYYWSNQVGDGLQYPGVFCKYEIYTPGTNCAYIYDDNSIVKQYVDSYQRILEEKGAKIKESRLLKVEEAYALGCGNGSRSCKDSPAYAPSWVYETTYWLGSALSSGETWFIMSRGQFGDYYNNDNMYGIRPVIVI